MRIELWHKDKMPAVVAVGEQPQPANTNETPSTGHPAERSDVQDQTGQEIKKLRRSITLLWICVLILSIDNRILSCRIDQILSSLELFAKSIENLVHVLH